MVEAVISMLAGLGVFLVGVNIMSTAMEKLADTGLKRMFGKISNNRLIGVGVGAISTALIQSSSITTVMVVGFCNAGMLTLLQATTVIMGANIGTTITAQIAALDAFPFTTYAMVLAFIGVFVTMVTNNERLHNVGSLMSGLGLLFVGMNLMSSQAKIIASEPAIVQLLSTINFPLLLLAIGAILTALLQSSAAVAIITISLVSGGIAIGSTGNAPLYIILGSNIGTCATALLSTMTGVHTNAKRAALIHLLFNLFGSFLFLIVLWSWSGFMNTVLASWLSEPGEQIAMFHTLFNVVSTAIFLPFANVFVRISEWLIKDKPQDKQITLSYIDERFLHTPTIAVAQAVKEIGLMGNVAREMLGDAVKGFLDRDITTSEMINKKYKEVATYDDNITKFLVQVSSNLKTYTKEAMIVSMHNVLGDLVRIADLSLNLVRYTGRVIEKQINFTPAVNVEIQQMFDQIEYLYDLTLKAFETRETSMLPEIDNVEEKIDSLRKQFSNNHIKRLNDGECSPSSGGVYTNMLSNLERIADHLTFVAHSIE